MKLEKTSLNDKFFEWDYLHLTALMKEIYFSSQYIGGKNKKVLTWRAPPIGILEGFADILSITVSKANTTEHTTYLKIHFVN